MDHTDTLWSCRGLGGARVSAHVLARMVGDGLGAS
jgi:hypothetical protein